METDEPLLLEIPWVIEAIHESREELARRVTRRMLESIPIVGVSSCVENKQAAHERNLELTARRFHDVVRTGATVSWELVIADFAWADRKLSTMGITREHRQRLMDIYFEEVLQLRPWTNEEQQVIQHIAKEMHRAAALAYGLPPTT